MTSAAQRYAPEDIYVPAEVTDAAVRSIGAFFAPICQVDPRLNAADFLDIAKARKRAGILQGYAGELGPSTKLLEIGPGFGTNLASWISQFQIDAYGVEPSGEGFHEANSASRQLLAANHIDPDRIVDAPGEALPFPDETFDIVYSANVLEHTADPNAVLSESIRVLKHGGYLHMEMPNYLSYFESHYLVVQPPILWKPMLRWWVRYVCGRNPAFIDALQTQINPVWCRRAVKEIGVETPVTLISLGEELFLERLSKPFDFEMQMVAGKIGWMIEAIARMNRGNWIGKLIVALQGHYPIYLTVRKD